MKIDGVPYRTIWVNEDGWSVEIIDQTVLPHQFRTVTLNTLDDAATAIRDILVRGASLIGATTDYGVRLALRTGGYPLSEAAQAHRDLEARKTTGSTVMLP